MVAADNSRCSEIGRDVITAAGNAADAAVAVALCLGVVNPVSSGLGGGAFITVRLADGTAAFIDARETAPAAATADMYQGNCLCCDVFSVAFRMLDENLLEFDCLQSLLCVILLLAIPKHCSCCCGHCYVLSIQISPAMRHYLAV